MRNNEQPKLSTAPRRVLATFLAASALSLVWTSFTPSLSQAAPKAVPLPVLVQRSDIIAIGEVVEQTSAYEGGVIWTTSLVRFDECLLGECVDGEYAQLRTVGGVVGDIEQRILGVAPLVVGRPATFFLRPSRDLTAWRPAASGAIIALDPWTREPALALSEGTVAISALRRLLSGPNIQTSHR